MKTIDTMECVLPLWCICPIVNDDYSGCDDRDEMALAKWNSYIQDACNANNAKSYTIVFPDDIDAEKYFHWHNDIDGSLGADVVNATIHFFA